MIKYDTKTRKESILLVEDEAIVAVTLRRALQVAGFEVPKVVSRGAEVAAAVEALRPDCIIMDIRLADQTTGIEAALEVRGFSDIPIVFVTGYPAREVQGEIERISTTKLLTKPAPPSEVIEAVKRFFTR